MAQCLRRGALVQCRKKGAANWGNKSKKKKMNTLRRYINIVEAAESGCPLATKDVELNTKNRDFVQDKYNYGPLNVDEPGDYWEGVADEWDTTVEAAMKSLCGNCVAFDISRMEECMPIISDDDDGGRLGYCWMHHLKCPV